MSHSKLHQIVSLREMLKKWRRVALKKAHSFSDPIARRGAGSAHARRSISMPSLRGGDGGSSRAGRVPAGHLAVYVGEERRRFVIKMWYLSHPLFRALLKKTEEEIGFQQEGALALPCEVGFFEQLLRIIHNSCKAHHQHRSLLQNHHPFPADEQYGELLLQLLESPCLSHYALSTVATCNLAHSLSSSFNVASQAVVV